MAIKPTMKLIAQQLDVSINAVSLTLNNKKGISQEMRNKILRKAEELGYFDKHNKYVRNYSNNNLCLLSQQQHSNDFKFYFNIIMSIEEEVKKNGYDLIFCLFDKNSYKIPTCIQSRKVSGILILGVIPDSFLKKIMSYDIPVVLVDDASFKQNINSIVSNSKIGAYKACNYLFENGITDIGFFGDLNYSYSIKERFEGVKEAFFEHFQWDTLQISTFLEEHSILSNLEESIIQKDTTLILKSLEKIKKMPKAFICSNDHAAIQLYSVLEMMGLKIPEDISVIGFDNINICTFMIPKLTTLNVDKKLMGEKSVQKLISLIKNKNQSVEQISLSVDLIVRDSVNLTGK